MEPMIASACLVGCACRYDGKSVQDPLLRAMFEAGDLIPVCPEVLGGLAIPRDPAEIVTEDPFRICTQAGVDVTAEYKEGARQTLAVARTVSAKRAILKSKSPSCGSKRIYDGRFRRQLIPGAGTTTRILREAGIDVINEEEAREEFLSSCTRILLLRHAESVFSADDRGRGLTADGEAEAFAFMERNREDLKVDAIYSSPYRRALDTAKPWAETLGLDLRKEERLRERRVADEPIDDFGTFAQWQWLDPDFALPGGESLNEVAERGLSVVRELESRHRGETILVATHGTWMGAVLNGLDPEFGYGNWRALQMPDLWELIFYKGILVNM